MTSPLRWRSSPNASFIGAVVAAFLEKREAQRSVEYRPAESGRQAKSPIDLSFAREVRRKLARRDDRQLGDSIAVWLAADKPSPRRTPAKNAA